MRLMKFQLFATKIIFEGPKEILDKTENTQPAIFLVGYSIFTLMREKFFNFDKALFFGHSLRIHSTLFGWFY